MSATIVEVFLEGAQVVEVTNGSSQIVEVFEGTPGPVGPTGDSGPVDTTTASALEDHIQSTDPHPNVVSTTAFDDWLDAMTPDI